MLEQKGVTLFPLNPSGSNSDHTQVQLSPKHKEVEVRNEESDPNAPEVQLHFCAASAGTWKAERDEKTVR